MFSIWIPNTALPTVEVGGVRLATDPAIQYCSIQTLYRGTFCFSSRCKPSFLVRAVSTGLLVSCIAGAIYWYPKNQLPRTSSTMSIPLTGRVWGDDGWVRLASLAPHYHVPGGYFPSWLKPTGDRVILEGPSSVAVSKIATPFRHPCANLSLALRLFLTAKGSKTWRSHGYHSF